MNSQKRSKSPSAPVKNTQGHSKSKARRHYINHSAVVELRKERRQMMELYVDKLAQGIRDRFELSPDVHEFLQGLLEISCEDTMVCTESVYGKFSPITLGEEDIEIAEVLALKGLISFISEDQKSLVLNWFLIENC